jgi:hypothetical protein
MKMTEKGEDDLIGMAVDAYELQSLGEQIFPDHVTDIKGLTVNGKTIENPATLAQHPAFNPIAVSLITALINISTLSADSEKNFDAPSTLPEAGNAAM